VGGREKIKLQKKTEIRAEKGQRKNVNLGWHRDRKENPICAPSIWFFFLVPNVFPTCSNHVPLRLPTKVFARCSLRRSQ
jgi:hypothetical protein